MNSTHEVETIETITFSEALEALAEINDSLIYSYTVAPIAESRVAVIGRRDAMEYGIRRDLHTAKVRVCAALRKIEDAFYNAHELSIYDMIALNGKIDGCPVADYLKTFYTTYCGA